MKLTWHLVKKDLRRMALPVAAWVVFTVVAAVWFASRRLPEVVAQAGDFSRWATGIGALAQVAVGMELVSGALLAAYLVLEDGLVGTTAQWLTRPISGARLLTAKVLAAVLLLVIAPAVALVPVWAAFGFSAGECARAAGEFAGWQLAVTVLAMGCASLVNDLGKFILTTVGVAVAFAVGASKPGFQLLEIAVSETLSGKAVILGLLPVAAGAVLAQQFWTRRRGRSWALIGVGLAAVVVVRVAGAGDFLRTEEKAPVIRAREVSLRVGAATDGVRVVALQEADFGVVWAVTVEASDRWEKFDGKLNVRDAGESASAGVRKFILTNRRLGLEQRLRETELGAMGLASMLTSVRRLELDPATAQLPAGWADGAVLRIVPGAVAAPEKF